MDILSSVATIHYIRACLRALAPGIKPFAVSYGVTHLMRMFIHRKLGSDEATQDAGDDLFAPQQKTRQGQEEEEEEESYVVRIRKLKSPSAIVTFENSNLATRLQ